MGSGGNEQHQHTASAVRSHQAAIYVVYYLILTECVITVYYKRPYAAKIRIWAGVFSKHYCTSVSATRWAAYYKGERQYNGCKYKYVTAYKLIYAPPVGGMHHHASTMLIHHMRKMVYFVNVILELNTLEHISD